MEITEATATLKDYAERQTQEPIVVTRKGTAIAALVRVQPYDLESLLVSENPVFKRSHGNSLRNKLAKKP